LKKIFRSGSGGLINYFLKRSAQRRMSTEKLFKILKKNTRFQEFSPYYFFYISIWDEIKKPKKA
jgi:membrane protein YqaA with SNARE-associated domain